MSILQKMKLSAGAAPAAASVISMGSIAEPMLAAANLRADIAQEEADVELAMIQLNNLQDLSDNIANVAVDGLSRNEATFVNGVVASANNAIGGTLIEMPALESFGDTVTAKSFTNVGNEALDTGMEKLWAWVKETMNKIADMFAKWWNKFFGAAEALGKAAEALKTKAAAYDGDSKEKVKVSVKSLAKGEGVSTSIKADMEALRKTVTDAIDHSEKIEEVISAVGEVAEQDADEAKLKTAGAKVVTAVVASTAAFTESGQVTDAQAMHKDLLGNKFMCVKSKLAAPAADAELSAFYKTAAGVGFKVADGATKAKGDDKEVARLSTSDIDSICDSIIEISKDIVDMRKSRNDVAKVNGKLQKSLDAAAKTSADEDAKEFKATFVAVGKLAVPFQKELNGGMVSAWVAHVTGVSKAVLGYCAGSIK